MYLADTVDCRLTMVITCAIIALSACDTNQGEQSSLAESAATAPTIVLGGSKKDLGMPAFGKLLDTESTHAIQAFISSQATKALLLQEEIQQEKEATPRG